MLIGLSGRLGAGKDTAYGFIKEWGEERGLTVEREAFADRLKLSAARLFFPEIGLEDAIAWCNGLKQPGAEVTAFYHDDEKRRRLYRSVDGRAFLQRFGTESHRDVFGDSFWVEHALQDVAADITAVTDVRFENEANAIRDRGGMVWQIQRSDLKDESTHVSERPLPIDLIDNTLLTDGSLDTLRKIVRHTLVDVSRSLRSASFTSSA